MEDLELSATGPVYATGDALWAEALSFTKGSYMALRVVMSVPMDSTVIALVISPTKQGPRVSSVRTP